MKKLKDENKEKNKIVSTKSKIITVMLCVSLFCIFSLLLFIILDDGTIFGSNNNVTENTSNENTNIDGLSESESWSMEDYNKEHVIKFNNKRVVIMPYYDFEKGIYKTEINGVEYNGYVAFGAIAEKDILIIECISKDHFLSQMLFFDKNLNLLKSNDYNYYINEKVETEEVNDFTDGTLIVNFSNSDFVYEGELLGIHDIYITGRDTGDSCDKYLADFRDELMKYKDEIVRGQAKLTYDGEKINFEYIDKVTVWDMFGDKIENNSKDYCVSKD